MVLLMNAKGGKIDLSTNRMKSNHPMAIASNIAINMKDKLMPQKCFK